MNNSFSVLPVLLIAAVPLALSVLNVVGLFAPVRRVKTVIVELLTIGIGFIYLYFALGLMDIRWVPWSTEIFTVEKYPPLDVSRLWQLYTVLGLGLVGWLFLRFIRPEKQPPLATVLAFGALYAVLTESVLFMIQIWGVETWCFILVYPFNLALITVKLIREQVGYRKEQPVKEGLKGLQKCLAAACSLPVIGFLFFGLAVGLVSLVLILFGQTPDELIRVWTNTAEWTFSTQTPPPKVPYDGHYLCTVAANGHRKLVRPLRTGKRGGHTILVNRQLMIANAFEDLLVEHTPRFHRVVRSFYDKTGFPLSRHITTKWRSDIVYLVMKPLEWLFLLVLYLFDARPEDRIAVQYMEKEGTIDGVNR